MLFSSGPYPHPRTFRDSRITILRIKTGRSFGTSPERALAYCGLPVYWRLKEKVALAPVESVTVRVMP